MPLDPMDAIDIMREDRPSIMLRLAKSDPSNDSEPQAYAEIASEYDAVGKTASIEIAIDSLRCDLTLVPLPELKRLAEYLDYIYRRWSN